LRGNIYILNLYLSIFEIGFFILEIENFISEVVEMNGKYEVLFEFRIRLLRPKPGKGSELDWALSSLGVDELGVKIYKLLLESEGLTFDEIVSRIGAEPGKIMDSLDQLYSLGLIDKLGSTYFISRDLSSSIRTRTLKVLQKVLDDIAKVVERGGSGSVGE